ncbi:MAG: hypothetical protein KPEEDBHJ_01293 [Anaerolineales bacterium]|nr:hypothetical protein [Anaerolineales bacterium]
MFGQSVFLPFLPSVRPVEILIVFTISCLAYFIVFNNFEKHLPMRRRLTKLFIVTGALGVMGVLFGRAVFWGIIALMAAGQIYLHGWYFPRRGINGLTAEPQDRYLEVIEKMKGKA